jgi:hypothetical protein
MTTILKTPEGAEIKLNIFTLRIHQKEGLKALCDIEVANDLPPLPDAMDVWMEGVCQFRGQVTGVLKHFTPQTCKIELTQMCGSYQAPPTQPIQFATPHEHLPVLPHYDRLTGQVSETHLLRGKQALAIDEKAIIDYTSTKQPALIGVDLCLEAKWRWQRVSFFDVWAEVKAQASGEFATLTPEAFIQKWHTALQLSPQSGYQVIYNQLSVQKPRFSGVFGNKKRIKGGVIDGQCLIRATQEQKYHEVVQCAFGKNCAQRKRLHLKVPMTDCDEVDFFKTPTGKLWFERAHAMAHNYFLASNRQTRITVEAALTPEVIARLTTDTQVTIGQRFAGKIIDYSITETSQGCLCRMVLCEVCDDSKMPIPTLPTPNTATAAQQSFVYDMDLQNLFDVQNARALTHTTGILKLPVTTVYLQLRDLTSQPVEPRVYRM